MLPTKKQTKIKRWRIFKIFPLGTIVPYTCVFLYQCIVYFFTELYVNQLSYKFDLSLSLDKKIPVIPGYIYIYFSCYLFWIANILLSGKISKEHFYKIITTSFLSITICGIIFVFFPTTIQRPEIKVVNLSTFLLHYLYCIDHPVNLFPSIHCLSSWLAYIAIRGQKQIPIWYRMFSLFFAISVFISTQVLKQHYLLDVVAGIVLVESVWQFQKRKISYTNQKLNLILEKLNQRLNIHW